MKKRRSVLLSAIALSAMMCSFAACNDFLNPPATSSSYSESATSSSSVGGESTSSASTGITPQPAAPGSQENPLALTVPGSVTVNYAAGAAPTWYTFTAEKDALLRVTLSNGAVMGYGTDKEEIAYTEEGATKAEFPLTEGTTYYVNFSTADFTAGTITATAEYVENNGIGDLTGIYQGDGLTVIVESNPDLLGGSITYKRASHGNVVVEEYIYEIVDGEFVFKYKNGNDVPSSMAAFILTNGVPTMAISNGNEYPIEKVSSSTETGETGFEGNYTIALGGYSSWSMAITSFSISIKGYNETTGLVETLVSGYTVVDGVPVTTADGALAKYTFTVEEGKITAITDTEEDATYSVSAIQSGEQEKEPDGTEAAPYPITLSGTQKADPDAANKTWYTFTADETGILTLTYPNANSWVDFKPEGKSTETARELQIIEFEVHAGVEYKLGLGVWDEEKEAIDVAFSFEAKALAEEGDFEKPLEIRTWGATTLDFAGTTADENKYVWYSYTHYHDATVTLTFTGNVNVKHGTSQDALTETKGVATLSFKSEPPQTYYIGVQTADLAAGTIEFTFSVVDAEGTSPDTALPLQIPGKATVEGCANGVQKWYTFTAEKDGFVIITYPDANSVVTYQEVDGNEEAGYSEKSYKFIAYADKTYRLGLGVSDAVEADFDIDITFEAGEVPHKGDFDLPYEIWVDSVAFEATTDTNKYVWYKYQSYITGTLTLTFEGAMNVKYGVSEDALEALANQTTFTMDIKEGSAYYIGIQTADLAAGTIKFELETLAAPGTSYDNPIDVEEGENSYDLPAEKEGYFVYNPKVNGTLTISVTSDNAAAYVYYYEGYSEVKIMAGETKDITVTSGTALMLILSTAPGTAATINFTASFSTGSSTTDPEPQGNVLTGGTTSVNATGQGVVYTFTAKLPGTYVISWTSENAVIGYEGEYGFEAYENGYEFTLASGESKSFIMSTDNWNNDTYDVTIAEKQEEPQGNVLTGGTTSVNATGQGVVYTFTAKLPGTYVISWTSENAVIGYEGEYGFEAYENGYEFTLASGESKSFIMCTDNWNNDTYDVTIAEKA